MRRARSTLAVLLVAAAACTAEDPSPRAGAPEAEALARCLRETGVTVYSSSVCGACREQQREFGAAWLHVREVECHPHAPDTQVDQCLARRIRVTPTWILDRDGEEAARLEGARTLSELAAFAGCDVVTPPRGER